MNSSTNQRRKMLTRSPLNKQFRLTQRDLAILNTITDFGGVLTTRQIAALYWPPATSKLNGQWVSRACTSRLRDLYDSNFLEREEQATKLSQGRASLLFFLTKQGRDEVAQMRKVEPKEVEWKPAGSFNPSFLEHRIKTNDFKISVILAVKRCGFEIKSWLDDQTLRRVHSQPSEKVTLTYPKNPQDPDSEVIERKVAIVPDGYFWLWTGEKNFHNFVEIDLRNVTGQYSDPGRKDFSRKIAAYSRYYTSGMYRLRYPEAGNSMRVLTVTTSEARLATLKEITERVIGKGKDSGLNRYWFTTFDKIAPAYEDFFNETILTGKIWNVAGRSELFSLVW